MVSLPTYRSKIGFWAFFWLVFSRDQVLARLWLLVFCLGVDLIFKRQSRYGLLLRLFGFCGPSGTAAWGCCVRVASAVTG